MAKPKSLSERSFCELSHKEMVQTQGGDIVPVENISMNYERIPSDQRAAFSGGWGMAQYQYGYEG